jgi:hypothetical protein
MTPKEYRACLRILIQYCPDEGKHFAESGKPQKHIFRDLMVLARYVDNTPPPGISF